MWAETQASAQSSFYKLNVENSCRKRRKFRYYIFEACPTLLYFFSLHQLFWLGLSDETNFWVEFGPVSFTHELLDIFCNLKSSKFNGFVLALFCIHGLGQNLTL